VCKGKTRKTKKVKTYIIILCTTDSYIPRHINFHENLLHTMTLHHFLFDFFFFLQGADFHLEKKNHHVPPKPPHHQTQPTHPPTLEKYLFLCACVWVFLMHAYFFCKIFHFPTVSKEIRVIRTQRKKIYTVFLPNYLENFAYIIFWI
jgi:hypothetical protein